MSSQKKPLDKLKWSDSHLKKVIPPKDLRKKIEQLRFQNQTIATTNGSFDLLHSGHLQTLYEGYQLADTLIVALNSDSSIHKYKSQNRPIIPLEYRIQMMSAIYFVDYVTWFDETDPRKILEIIRPDVHINCETYGDNCKEADVVKQGGGRLHLVKLIPSLSTSSIIDKIRETPT